MLNISYISNISNFKVEEHFCTFGQFFWDTWCLFLVERNTEAAPAGNKILTLSPTKNPFPPLFSESNLSMTERIGGRSFSKNCFFFSSWKGKYGDAVNDK